MRALLCLALLVGCDDGGSTEVSPDGAAPDASLAPAEWEAGGWIYGWSVQDRPLIVEQYGEVGPVMLVFAGIHGNERSAVTFGEELRVDLLGGLASRAGVRIAFVGAANPDGVALETRHNANDVDLNRNFPTDNFAEMGGSFPLSQPESRRLKRLIDEVDPSAVLSIHCCVPTLDYDGPSEGLAQAMAEAMDPAARFPVERLGSRAGSVGSYVGLELDRPIVTVEFAVHAQIDTRLQLESMREAVRAAADWVERFGDETGPLDLSSLEVTGSEAFVVEMLGVSAGGLPIRLERRAGEGTPLLLLAGLDGDPRATSFAEHLRRRLYAVGVRRPLMMLTAANPDGLLEAVAENHAGVPVGADFAGEGISAEAQALRALLEDDPPGLIVYLRGGEVRDTIYSELALSDPPAPARMRALPDDALTRALSDSAELVEVAVHRHYGRGDDVENLDLLPALDPGPLSAWLIGELAPAAMIAVPPEPCDCDYNAACEAAERDSTQTCACDPDCAGGHEACEADEHCDTWCSAGADPDC